MLHLDLKQQFSEELMLVLESTLPTIGKDQFDRFMRILFNSNYSTRKYLFKMVKKPENRPLFAPYAHQIVDNSNLLSEV